MKTNTLKIDPWGMATFKNKKAQKYGRGGKRGGSNKFKFVWGHLWTAPSYLLIVSWLGISDSEDGKNKVPMNANKTVKSSILFILVELFYSIDYKLIWNVFFFYDFHGQFD